ncbi:MAG: diacylglycerol kinase family lipid kinase [Sedimentisphaerales bacterium]|nr:diacylglycerol kinase family lipid kinase [Sedimentisphaerales bacterium]
MKPQDGYIAFIVNPKAGSSSNNLLGRRFAAYLRGRGFDVRTNLTMYIDHATKLAQRASSSYDCTLIVAVGGDGTIREVAHGLDGTNKPLMMVPHGTENLLASELGFDEKLETLIRTFEAQYTRPLDLGRVNDRCFTSIAGFGFDGQVVDRVHRGRTGHITHLDYLWPIWRSFSEYKFRPMNVRVDGEEISHGQGLVFVGNISRYSVGLKILERADFGDGLLDVCVYKCASRLHLASHSIRTFFKGHSNSSDVIYRQGKDIDISSEHGDIFTQIDGDPGPPLPAHITVIPNAVNVMVPEGARPAGFRTRIIRALR